MAADFRAHDWTEKRLPAGPSGCGCALAPREGKARLSTPVPLVQRAWCRLRGATAWILLLIDSAVRINELSSSAGFPVFPPPSRFISQGWRVGGAKRIKQWGNTSP